jgi:hypothetical protein
VGAIPAVHQARIAGRRRQNVNYILKYFNEEPRKSARRFEVEDLASDRVVQSLVTLPPGEREWRNTNQLRFRIA